MDESPDDSESAQGECMCHVWAIACIAHKVIACNNQDMGRDTAMRCYVLRLYVRWSLEANYWTLQKSWETRGCNISGMLYYGDPVNAK